MPRSIMTETQRKVRTKRINHRVQQAELRKNQRELANQAARTIRRRGFGGVNVEVSTGTVDVTIEHFPSNGNCYKAYVRYFWSDTSTVPDRGLLLSSQGRNTGKLPPEWTFPNNMNEILRLLREDFEVCASYQKE